MVGVSIRAGSDDLEWPWKAGREKSFFQADLLNNTRTIWPRTTKFGRITYVMDGRISRAGLSAPECCGFLSIYAYTLCRWTAKFDMVTHMGTGLISRALAKPSPQRGGVTSLLVLGVPFYLCVYPLCRGTTKFDVVCHMFWHVARGVYLGVSHASIPRERSFSAHRFWGSPVFMPTPFNAERPNSAW